MATLTSQPLALAVASTTTPIGAITVVSSPDGVRAVRWGRETVAEDGHGASEPAAATLARERLEQALQEIAEYFEGKRQRFETPLDLEGTDFQRLVWEALARIPYGETHSYGAIATAIGRPAAARAVGAGRDAIPCPSSCPATAWSGRTAP